MTRSIDSATIPSKADDVLATEADDVAVLMSMDTGKFIELNDTARVAWDLTDGTASIADLAERMAERFDVTAEHCQASLITLYDRLAGEGLVTLA